MSSYIILISNIILIKMAMLSLSLLIVDSLGVIVKQYSLFDWKSL